MKIKTISMNSSNLGEQLVQSFKETGFAIIVDHKINKDLLDEAYGYWKEFYSKPLGQKKELLFNPNANNQDGYFPFKSESAKDSKIGDLKEFYHVYRNGRQLPGNSNVIRKLFNDMQDLGAELLQHIDSSLPKDIYNTLKMDLGLMATNSSSTLLRSIHYPPVSNIDAEQGAVRAAAHEDINLITLLPAATYPGLQVKDLDGNWHWADKEAPEGSIIVNVGDMLQEATGNYFKSTTHRVVNPTGYGATISRYSMPLFVHPHADVRLSDRYTAGEYLEERLKELGLK